MSWYGMTMHKPYCQDPERKCESCDRKNLCPENLVKESRKLIGEYKLRHPEPEKKVEPNIFEKLADKVEKIFRK